LITQLKIFILLILCLLYSGSSFTQNNEIEREKEMKGSETDLWLSSYNIFRISEKFFWDAQLHYRRKEYGDTKFVGRMAQLYNRHALGYKLTPYINTSIGGVLRLDYAPEPGSDLYEPFVYEPRLWYEFLFVMPQANYQITHRLRFEHRWSRSARKGAEWMFRNRYRYQFSMKIPLGNNRLKPGTFYAKPDIEIILQSGKNVVDSPIDDLRLYGSLVYIANPRVSYSAGLMYTTGQDLNDGSLYKQRWVMRFSAYVSMDFRKKSKQLPSINFTD
tara:strand:+ start:2874 stop:3695 length:822 start_codon:yes stop_codon:yes gene_type:complete